MKFDFYDNFSHESDEETGLYYLCDKKTESIETAICSVKNKDIAKLFSSAPEMLDALIELVNYGISEKMAYYGSTKTTSEITKYYQKYINIIEKATGKTWEEINND